MPDLDYNVLIAYALGLVLLVLILRAFLVPLRFLLRVSYHLVVGGLIIWLVNLVGGLVGFQLALNPVSALLAGYLGIPGVALLAVIRAWVA